ncbi:MAG: hypothetical protein WCP68_18420, partial [Enhydrobacter sp.]
MDTFSWAARSVIDLALPVRSKNRNGRETNEPKNGSYAIPVCLKLVQIQGHDQRSRTLQASLRIPTIATTHSDRLRPLIP